METQLRNLFALTLKCDPADFQLYERPTDDSLEFVELASAAELEFNIEITDAELEETQTFGDFVKLVEGKL